MKPKPTPKEEKDPEVFLRRALVLTQCQPTADEDEIEEAIRAYGDAVRKEATDKAKRSK